MLAHAFNQIEPFRLDPALKKNTFPVVRLKLCQVLLQNDERFPWLIMVPAIANIQEIYQLPSDQQHLLMNEMSIVSQVLQVYTMADKINIAAFGNITPQLHIHVIARFIGDSLWPNPVIGVGEKVPYKEIERDEIIRDLQEALLKG